MLVSACGFQAPASTGNPGNGGRPPADGQTDTDSSGGLIGDAQLCFGTGLVQVCLASLPTTPLIVSSSQTISTEAASSSCVATTNTTAMAYCVVAATAIQIDRGRILRGTGPRPIVLVSTSTLSLAGAVDVASHGASPGAGANSPACVAGKAAGSGGSGGGGYGGSFGAKGGNGETNDGGSGGVAAAPTVPEVLRGGCAGGRGGGQGSGEKPGDGGGAVALIAAGSISIDGTIDASGAGGRAGMFQDAGGPGGGSGGMIVLDGRPIDVTRNGMIFANGGGGAGGNSMFRGRDGSDPALPAIAAPGGAGGTSGGGDGGDGSLGGDGRAPPGNANPQGGGGGGGGGGTGVVKSNEPLSGAISPAPS